jgi:hypothetical protein
VKEKQLKSPTHSLLYWALVHNPSLQAGDSDKE